MKLNPNQPQLQSAFRVTSKNIRPLKWILLGPLFALLLLTHSLAAEWWEVPPRGQRTQMWSKVRYDPKLTDPFFESNEWTHLDPGMTPEERPRSLKHTAKCSSNSFGVEHLIDFCHAKLLDGDMIDLLIAEAGGGFTEELRVQVRNGTFASHYWAAYVADPRDLVLTWTTKRQELTLDKKAYLKGDIIKGKIDFECVEEIATPKYVEKHGKNPTTIKVHGVFKTVVK